MVADWQHTEVAPGDIVIATILNKHPRYCDEQTHGHMNTLRYIHVQCLIDGLTKQPNLR